MKAFHTQHYHFPHYYSILPQQFPVFHLSFFVPIYIKHYLANILTLSIAQINTCYVINHQPKNIKHLFILNLKRGSARNPDKALLSFSIHILNPFILLLILFIAPSISLFFPQVREEVLPHLYTQGLPPPEPRLLYGLP